MAKLGTILRLRPHVLEELARHGLAPLPATTAAQLRDAVRDLYRYEIRRLRSELLAGHIASVTIDFYCGDHT